MGEKERKAFLSRIEAETDSNISDIIRRQELATEILKKPISQESQKEVQKRLEELRPYLEEDIEL